MSLSSSVTIKPEKVLTEEELYWAQRSQETLGDQKGMTIIIRSNDRLIVAFSMTNEAIDSSASALQEWMDNQVLTEEHLPTAVLAHSVMVVQNGEGSTDTGQRLMTVLLATARLGRAAQYQCRLGDMIEPADVAIINPEDSTVTFHAVVKAHSIN